MQVKPSLDELISMIRAELSEELMRAHRLGFHEGTGLIMNPILTRLIACADNGYDTAELHAIVEDAKKAVSE